MEFSEIENTNDAKRECDRYTYGTEEYEITIENIIALLKGKCLTSDINCGEYTVFITLSDDATKISLDDIIKLFTKDYDN